MPAVISALKQALKADPSNWETRLSLAEACLKEGLAKEAASLIEGVALPSEENAVIAAARCHALVGSPRAREILQPVLSAHPSSARAELALAFIAHREGDTVAAAGHFAKARSLDASLTAGDRALTEAYGSADAAGGTNPIVLTASDVLPDTGAVPRPHAVPPPDAGVGAGEAHVVCPAPGEFPVEPLDVAVATHRIRPLVDPRSVPEPAKLVVESGTTAKVNLVETGLVNPILEPHEGEKLVFDYNHPDQSAFAPTYGPDRILVAASYDEEGRPIASPEQTIRAHLEEAEAKHRRSLRRDKVESLIAGVAFHVGVIFIFGLIAFSVPRPDPPQIVAVASPTLPTDTLEKKKVLIPTQASNTKPPSRLMNVVSAAGASSFAVPTMKNRPLPDQAVFGTSFTPSLDFAPAGQEGMPAIFGEKIDGKKLGVILDVSGSMSEYLPKIVREIDRNFEKASIIFVNNFILRDKVKANSEIRPIITDDVKPRYPDGTHTPYWFLWYDLPRKAEQAAVDRLITIFKERPNCYLAVDGENRIASAMDHLRSLGVDAIYMFSDYEDYTDEEITATSSKELSKVDIKVYVQPLQERTEFLEIVTRKLAARTGGRELKPLIQVLPVEEAPQPLLAEVMEPKPVKVEGVNYATLRPARTGKEFYEYQGPGGHWKLIEVYERDTFDLVLYGPSARADIFLKTKDGYIGSPVRFTYWSRKWILDERGDWRWRQRHWLRNIEEPKLEGNEITWKMVLEDEQEFEVWFKFDGNSFMATYAAGPAPHEKGDHTSIGFHMPPLATERNDTYYSSDFPQGRNLDGIREAARPNHTVFNLSSKDRDRYATQWKIYAWEPGINIRTHDVLVKQLPDGIVDARVSGQSYGPRILTVATRQNDILLHSDSYRADIELWQGYHISLSRPAGETRHRLTKTEAFQLTIE